MIRPIETTYGGYYFDGATGSRHEVRLALSGEGFEVTPLERWVEVVYESPVEAQMDTLAPFVWPYEECELVSDGVYGDPARVARKAAPAAALLVESDSFVDAVRQRAPKLLERPFWDVRIKGWPAVLMASLGVTLLVGLLYVYALGFVSESVARVAPRSLEVRLGRSVLNALVPEAVRCSDGKREAVIQKILADLSARAQSPYTFRIVLARQPYVNAFALPGGTIVITDYLIRLTETPEEFAAVLAHEMQHIEKRHSTRAIARELGGRTLLNLISLDAAGTPYGAQYASQLIDLSFQRDMEFEADAEGARLLAKLGIGPEAMQRFLKRMDDGDSGAGATKYLSTHPGTQERIAALGALGLPGSAKNLGVSKETWEDTRKICSGN